jgi:hypothetical protein
MMPGDRDVAITAIVHAPDGVRFVATGVSRERVAARVASYVRERCDDVLWAEASREVHAMLAVGNLDAAITAYFRCVGERWDDERLDLFIAEREGARWTSEDSSLIDARR